VVVHQNQVILLFGCFKETHFLGSVQQMYFGRLLDRLQLFGAPLLISHSFLGLNIFYLFPEILECSCPRLVASLDDEHK
jgi:hypothetical protein